MISYIKVLIHLPTSNNCPGLGTRVGFILTDSYPSILIAYKFVEVEEPDAYTHPALESFCEYYSQLFTDCCVILLLPYLLPLFCIFPISPECTSPDSIVLPRFRQCDAGAFFALKQPAAQKKIPFDWRWFVRLFSLQTLIHGSIGIFFAGQELYYLHRSVSVGSMLSFTRIFLSPSSLSPALHHPLRFLFLFSLAFLINSVITFAEATPVPPGIPQPSEIFQFERCTSHKTSGFLFRVGFYDPQGGKTTKFGQGVLVVCIGMNYCFGYTTTTTTAGGGGSVGTVIYTSPQRRNVIKGVSTDAYHQLSIKPDCDKFNTWSFSNGPEHNPGRTLVDFLMNIADLQSALRDYPHNASDPVTIDSEASYILAVLDYLQSRGMLKTYDRSQIKEFLETLKYANQLKNANQLPSSSMLSWGFRNFQGKGRWILLTGVPSEDRKTTLLCFGIRYCFGLHDKSEVKYLHPVNSHQIPDKRYLVWMRSSGLYPSFDLQKFEEQLGASRTSFLARLTAQSQDVISFQDSSDEIRKETGLEKRDGEDMDTFYFRVLLGYMAAKGIIGNYNRESYGKMMNALQLARAGKTNAAMAAELGASGASSSLPPSGDSGSTQQAPAHDTPGTNSQGGGAADYPPKISVSSMLQNANQAFIVIAVGLNSAPTKSRSAQKKQPPQVSQPPHVSKNYGWLQISHRISVQPLLIIRALFDVQPRALQVQTRVIIQLFYRSIHGDRTKLSLAGPSRHHTPPSAPSLSTFSSISSYPKFKSPTHQQPEQQLDLDHPIYPGNGVAGTTGVGSGVYTVEGVYTIDRLYTVEGVHTGVAIHESGGGGGGRTQTGSGRIGGMYCGVGVGLGRLFERRKTWGPPVAGAAGAAWATGAGAEQESQLDQSNIDDPWKWVSGKALVEVPVLVYSVHSIHQSVPEVKSQSKDPEKRNNSKTALVGPCLSCKHLLERPWEMNDE
ncbi:hypothetical protein EV359DRAFT_66813 [Lentinula novae-zelandiae]|nr:hypothetical protein EV359DRAFT_66813 [Lentinula novae-zelandiae]